MGSHDILIDTDIIFLIFKIHKLQYEEISHFLGLLKSALNWHLIISDEVEDEIKDSFSNALREKLAKEGILERFLPSNSQELREIAQAYKDLRRPSFSLGRQEPSAGREFRLLSIDIALIKDVVSSDNHATI